MKYPVHFFLVFSLIVLALVYLPISADAATYQSFSDDEAVKVAFDFSSEAGPQTIPDKILTFFHLQQHTHRPRKVTLLDSQKRVWYTAAKTADTADAKPIVTMPPLLGHKPGLYTLRTEYEADGKTYTKEQNFAWGVLALNTNKSIYAPNEQAFIALAVLDEHGKTVCDATVHLEITNAEGEKTTLSTTNGLIKVNNPQCQAYEVNDKPDYFATYTVGKAGTYRMDVTAQTKNGTFTVTDAFEVRDSIAFDIERDLATRIYPPKTYPVEIKIKANQDFDGEIVETVPFDFEISDQTTSPSSVVIARPRSGEAISSAKIATSQIAPRNDNNKEIQWRVTIKKGETITLGYSIKFPQRSPDFYLMGPLSFYSSSEARSHNGTSSQPSASNNTLVFQELRQWQIASDAIALVQSASNTVANSTTLSIASGQGWAAPTANNLIVAVCAARTNATMAMNTPAGMSSLANQTSGTVLGHRMFYKVAAGSGETTLTCSGPGSNTRMLAVAYEYSGTATSSVLETSDDTGSGTGTSPVTNAIVPSTDNDRIVASIATSGTTNGTISFAGWTNSYTEGSGGADGDLSVGTSTTRLGLGTADLNKTPAGSTSTGATITNVSAANPYVSTIAAFAPPSITISGNAYTDEAGTPTVWTGAGHCDDSTQSIGLAINGSKIGNTTCSSSDGSWQFTSQTVASGDIITVYMDTGGGDKGVVYTKANNATSAISGLKVTKNRVWIRSEQASNFTNANINQFDKSSNDTDIPADSDGTNLTVDSGVKLVVDSSKTFAPGGNVTVASMELLGTYSGSSETLTFTGSGTGSTCSADPGTLRPLCINGGTFTAPTNTQFQGTADSAIQATTYASLEFNPTITGAVQYTGSGAITVSTDLLLDPSAATTQTLTVLLGGTTSVGGATNVNVAIGNSAKTNLDTDSSNNYSFTTGTLRIWSGGTLTANNSTITLNGTSGTKFQLDVGGAFTAGGSTVAMQGDAALTLTSGTFTGSNAFYNLVLNPTISTGRTYSLGSGAITVNNNFTINPGTAANLLTVVMGANITVTGTTQITRTSSATSLLTTTNGSSDFDITTGKLEIDTGGTLTPNSSTITLTGSGTGTSRPFYINGGTFSTPTGTLVYQSSSASDVQSTTYHHLTFNGNTTFTLMAGGITTDNGGNLTISQGILDTNSGNNYAISVGGNWSNSGTFTAQQGTVTFTATASGKTLGGTMTGSSAFYDITFTGSGGGWTFNAAATAGHDFTITLGAVTAPSGNLTISRNFAHTGGTFTHNSGKVIIAGSGTSTITGATTFNDFSSTAAGKTIAFEAGTIFTFAGTVTLTGASGNKITINSSDGATQWLAQFGSAQTGSTYLSVNNSGCDTGTATITLNATSTDDGGNNDTSCWVFSGGGPSVQSQIQGGTTIRGGTKIGQ